MHVAHEKLAGLDRDRVIAAVGPVLTAHGVDAVELVWRTDRNGWVLELTVERPGSRIPGEGITLDLCSEISRDLSRALDVADVIPHRYRLEVGSPGVERALYDVDDFSRFSGRPARLKLREPVAGQRVVYGTLQGLDEVGSVLVQLPTSELARLDREAIESARLVFQLPAPQRKPGSTQRRSAAAQVRRSRSPGGDT